MSQLSSLLFMFSLSPCLMDFTCLPDMVPSPGVSLPRGDIKVLVGSDPVNLTCHLNPDHLDYKSGIRAIDLAFKSNNTVLKSNILNATSISSMFSPVEEGVTDIMCIIKSGNSVSRPKDKGVCTQKILVGHEPEDVSNFSCESYNWGSLNCTWTEPLNPVPTKYDVHFTTKGTWAGFKRCPSRTMVEARLKLSLPPELRMCYLDYVTIPQYRHVSRNYQFYINATNSLLPGGIVYHHSVNQFSIMRPGPATQLTLTSPSSTTVQATWGIPRELWHFPPGLRQIVRYKSEWEDQLVELDTSGLNTTQRYYNISLPGPLKPFTSYTVEVTMLTNLPTTPHHLHSAPVLATTRTKPAPPTRPPTTNQACFEVVEGDTESRLLVYWQSLEAWEEYGPQFQYKVIMDGEDTPVPNKITSSFAQFDNLSSKRNFLVSILSSNSVGISSESTLNIPSLTSASSLLPLSVTKIYEEDDILTLSWLPPKNADHVTSYTLFWCKDSKARDRPYQCEGFLDWKTITTEQLNGSLSHSLVLPLDSSLATPVYQLAVAANTDTFSSGMQWTSCSVKNDQIVNTRVTDVTVDTFSPTTVLVRWKLDCSKISGLVNSFVVKYCKVGDVPGSCLVGSMMTVLVPPGSYSKEVEQLSPHTHYQFTISVQDRVSPLPGQTHHSGTGPPSTPVTTVTMSAPPGSPPRNLAATEITSSQATFAWDQPTTPNGEICKYLVQLRNMEHEEVVRNMDTVSEIVKLSNLTSYTTYQVSVAACSISSLLGCELCSKHWTRQNFTTLVGTPGQATMPKVRLVNSSAVEVVWKSNFPLGAPAVNRWFLRSGRGYDTDLSSTVLFTSDGSITRTVLDLVELGLRMPGCENSSVYTEYYGFSVMAEVVNDAGSRFSGPWSDTTLQAVYCTPALPWVMLVLVVVAIIITLFCLGCLVYCVTWYRRKTAIIKKIGEELDSREIVPVVIPNIELGQIGGHHLVEEEQCTVYLPRTHKNSDSTSSDDSGVCSQPPSSPTHHGISGCSRQDSGLSDITTCTRQDSGLSDSSTCTKLDRGGSDMSGYTRQDSGVAGLSPLPKHSASLPSVPGGYIPMSTQQSPVSDTGYSHVGSKPYLPLTAVKQAVPHHSPGYLSLGQVQQQLVLQPNQSSGAYSRVGATTTPCNGCEGGLQGSTSTGVPTGIQGVSRLKFTEVPGSAQYGQLKPIEGDLAKVSCSDSSTPVISTRTILGSD